MQLLSRLQVDLGVESPLVPTDGWWWRRLRPAHVLWSGASAVRAAAFISAGFHVAVAVVSQRAEAGAV